MKPMVVQYSAHHERYKVSALRIKVKVLTFSNWGGAEKLKIGLKP